MVASGPRLLVAVGGLLAPLAASPPPPLQLANRISANSATVLDFNRESLCVVTYINGSTAC